MKIIQLPAGYGKSIIALHAAINNKVPLVVPTTRDVERIKSVFNELKCNNPLDCKIAQMAKVDIISWNEYQDNPKYKKIKNVVIDDFDRILDLYYGLNTDEMTVTFK